MDSRTVRRLTWVAGAVMFLDAVFYAVVSPMLPQLTHELGMSKSAAGVLTAAYPAGVLCFSLPAGLLTIRIGPRLTVVMGLALFIGSTLVFAFARSTPGLDLARFVEGAGSAFTWSGALTWLTAATASTKRGEMVGRAVGAAIGGAILGPAVGALASATGRPALFCGLILVAVLVLLASLTLPDARSSEKQGLSDVLRALTKRPVLIAGWLVFLPATASGMNNVLGSLRLHGLGASSALIGGTFLVGAVIDAVIAPRMGRLSDRRGRMLPLRVGLVVVAIVLAGYTVPDQAMPAAALIVVLIVSLGTFWAPAMAMLADVSDAVGLDQAHASALMNLTWAGGQIVGAGGGGAAAKATGDLAVTIVISGLCLFTLMATAKLGRARPRVSAPLPASDQRV